MGNLKNCIESWRKITSDPWILETISGYHLEFASLPHQAKLPASPPFNPNEVKLIGDEVQKLVKKGAINEVYHCKNEFISNLFLVPKKTGDFRPVINLKPLNQFVEEIHFKMENIQMVLNAVSPGDYMASLDLKDAYFSVPIFQPHRKYLRFRWQFKLYEFTCLPFGYSLAPRVFTKIFKPIIAHFRFLGFRVFIYIDDISLVASSFDECKQQLAAITQILEGLGFLVNKEKSQILPVTEIRYLGFLINSINMKLFLPELKLGKIVTACAQLVAQSNPTIREVARVAGLLVAALPAVNYLKLYYRSLEICKTESLFQCATPDYDRTITLSAQARSDLNWVIHNIAKYNGKCFCEPDIDIFIHCDASLSGWGAVCQGQSANGSWSVVEAENHINYLELLAAFHGLQCFVPTQQSVHVRISMDNSTAVSYINNMGGTKSHSLDTLSRCLWEWCISRQLHVSAQHVPGASNIIADQLSRTIDCHLEWSLNNEVYKSIICQIGFTPELDLFASRLNAKTDKFVSWHPEPGAVAYDAFAISWAELKCYAFPPFSVLPRVLAKILRDQARILLIAPVWPTQNWYPLLLRLLVDVPILLPRS